MAMKEILLLGNPLLREKSEKVTDFGPEPGLPCLKENILRGRPIEESIYLARKALEENGLRKVSAA